MYYSPTHDPAGQPWTRASVSQEINRLAYELYRVGQIPNESLVCNDVEGRAAGVFDEVKCQELTDASREQLREVDGAQRELQAIAAHLVQPGTPSVVGPGAINIMVDEETGDPEFVTTPLLPVSPPASPNGAGPPSPNGFIPTPSDGVLPEDDGERGAAMDADEESRGKLVPLALAGLGLALVFFRRKRSGEAT